MIFSRLLGVVGLGLMAAGAALELFHVKRAAKETPSGNVAKPGDLRAPGNPPVNEHPGSQQPDGVRGVEPPPVPPAPAANEGKPA